MKASVPWSRAGGILGGARRISKGFLVASLTMVEQEKIFAPLVRSLSWLRLPYCRHVYPSKFKTAIYKKLFLTLPDHHIGLDSDLA